VIAANLADTLVGARLLLRPFRPEDITERYLDWLADRETNRYSRRFGQPRPTRAAARRWLEERAPEEFVYAVTSEALGHVGNIKAGPIDRDNNRADISILLGERRAWNCGFGAEAVYLVTRRLFLHHGLGRVDAGSGNPAFLRLVDKLGWRVEKVLRNHVQIGGEWLDWTLVAQHRDEFRRRPEYEQAAR
jgi:RimJ/RimL family protein N-acetyltransferase